MNNKLLIPAEKLYFIALFGVVFSVITVSFDASVFGLPPVVGNLLTGLALLCSFVTVVVLIIDVFKNNVAGKYLWTLGFLFTAGITGLFYLRSRSRYSKSS